MRSTTRQRYAIRQPTWTDPDPHGRHRADCLVLVAGGMPLTQVAQVFGWAPNSLRRWGEHFLAEDRDGLADQACAALGCTHEPQLFLPRRSPDSAIGCACGRTVGAAGDPRKRSCHLRFDGPTTASE